MKDSNIIEKIAPEAKFFSKVDLQGINTTIGYYRKFKLGWFATQLNVFLCIGKNTLVTDSSISEMYSSSCLKYSIKMNPGLPIGMQSEIAAINILVGTNVDTSAKNFCESFRKNHWSAIEYPIIYDLEKHIAYRPKSKPIWGGGILSIS